MKVQSVIDILIHNASLSKKEVGIFKIGAKKKSQLKHWENNALWMNLWRKYYK